MEMLTDKLDQYQLELEQQELAKNTVSKYMRDAKGFLEFAGNQEITKDLLVEYKTNMQEQGLETSTINSRIISINKFLRFAKLDEATIKTIRVQTRDLNNVLSQTDYDRMLRQAKQKDKGTDRDVLMLEAFYRTGVRVSELQYLTVESVQAGYMDIDNKGKIRRVPISKTLSKECKAYCKEHGITSGSIILNAAGEPLGRSYIFKRIKYLAGQARIKKDKAYPHSIRHLFAKNWLERNSGRVTQLADILGHESLDTTRIYTKLSLDEARETMD